MPFTRPDSQYLQIRLRKLPGFGDTGVLSSKSKSKKIAEHMERLLVEIAERALLDPAWRALLVAVKDRRIDLPTLVQAKAQNRLPALLRSLSDPELDVAVDALRRARKIDRQTGLGLDRLMAYAPTGARLSYLADARTITALCVRALEEGQQRNTVRRQLHRAASLLLTFHYGKAERNRIFADVQFEGEDDTREVALTREELDRLLAACTKLGYHEMKIILQMALLTSADRGVLLAGPRSDGDERGMRVRDVAIFEEKDGTYSGEVYLPDKKTPTRPRTVPFGDRLARELFLLIRDKGDDEPVFSIPYRQFDHLWKRVREEAGLGHVRFKDLRAQFAIFADKAGIPTAVTSKTMGHKHEAMTGRYQRHQAVMTDAHVDALERAMFGDAKQS